MKTKKTPYEIFQELVIQLPECTQNLFFYGLANKSMLTKISYARDVIYFLEFALNSFPYFSDLDSIKQFTHEKLGKITPEDINVFLTWMEDNQDLAVRTMARRKASISVMFDYMVNTQQKLASNPVTGAQKIEFEHSEYVTYLKLEEQKKLLECIKTGNGLTPRQLLYHDQVANRDLAIVFLFLDTGLRVSELQSLNVKDIITYEDRKNPDNNEYYVEVLRKGRKKNKTISKVYFSDESWLYISNYLEDRENAGEKFNSSSPLFLTIHGNRISIREIEKMLSKYILASLGRSDISPHKLRSSFAMEFYRAEKDILVLQTRMGHRSIAATNIYAKASDKEDSVKKSRNWRK